jgi:hypothetical protein
VLQGLELDQFLDLFTDESTSSLTENNSAASDALPKQLDSECLKEKGVYNCAYESLADMMPSTDPTEPLIEIQHDSTSQAQSSEEPNNNCTNQSCKPTINDIASILLTKTSHRCRTFESITKCKEELNVLEANGSVSSIIDWAKKAKLDQRQKHLFEILARTFVLSFFDDSNKENPMERTRNHIFLSESQNLEH